MVRWTAPNDGGSALTNYTVTPYVGGSAQTPVTVNAPATRATVTGLDTSTSYTFRVRANNANGAGATSAETNAVTPLRSIFGFATPTTVDSGDGGSVELGVRFRSSQRGIDRRHPLLQGVGQHRHARGQPVDGERDAARPGELHG